MHALLVNTVLHLAKIKKNTAFSTIVLLFCLKTLLLVLYYHCFVKKKTLLLLLPDWFVVFFSNQQYTFAQEKHTKKIIGTTFLEVTLLGRQSRASGDYYEVDSDFM